MICDIKGLDPWHGFGLMWNWQSPSFLLATCVMFLFVLLRIAPCKVVFVKL